jgi:hypothetical protein
MRSTPTDSDADLDALRRHYDRIGRPDRPTLMAIRRDVLTGIAAMPPRARVRTVSRRGLLMTAAAGGAAAAVATVAVLPIGADRPPAGSDGDPVPATLGAADTLALVANRTGNAQSVNVAAGEYVYTSSRARRVGKAPVRGAPAWYVADTVTQSWASADGLIPERVVVTIGGNAEPLTGADAKMLAGSTYPWRATRTTTFRPDREPATDPVSGVDLGSPGPFNPTPAYLRSLPVEPAGLLAALRSAMPRGKPDPTGREPAQQIFLAVAGLVGKADALLSPQLRAALYRALALLPGVSRIAGQVDLAGHRGVAITHTDQGVRSELIIDPVSSRAIGTRLVLVTPSKANTQPAGTVLELSTTEQRVVSAVGATT